MVPKIRKGLNEARNHPKDEDPFTYDMGSINISEEPKYKIGSKVYRPLEKPRNEQGKKHHNSNWRMGDLRFDMIPIKVKKIFAYPNIKPPWKYILEGYDNVAYGENELRHS